ncbi:MAG TPA: ABC transporter permease subunit [Thermoclostridium sp.]|nr:ABC transporter permease subunit [Thermoclostridium sp.]
MENIAKKKSVATTGRNNHKQTFLTRLKKDFNKNKGLYLLALPVLAYYLIFKYGPMFGVSIAFKDFTPGKGFIESNWVGLKHFKAFFTDYYFTRVIKNTLIISLGNLLFSFPAPIMLALLVNELKNRKYSRLVQTITYLPHFISTVVLCSMIIQLTMKEGAINQMISVFGFQPVTMLNQPKLFVPIYIISNIWQNTGWNSIIYLAALTAIDPELYTAAKIDGANRFRQLIHITLPGLLPTVIIMFILQIGKMFNVGHEKILLLYNELTYETAEVISTYVYKKGLLQFNWSYSAAVGLFNSIVSFALVYTTNRISKATNDTSLW